MVDAKDLKSFEGFLMPVRVRPSAPVISEGNDWQATSLTQKNYKKRPEEIRVFSFSIYFKWILLNSR